MSLAQEKEETSPYGLVFDLATWWALAGGVVLLLVVLMNTWSIIGNQFGKPFPGDFEMTEIGIAVAVFAFLPYCQLTSANVTADIFTSKASSFTVAFLSMVASLVALGFSLLLMWRMYAGMLDQKNYDYETAVLQFPNWIAWIPVLFSLALLVVCCLATLIESWRDMRA